MQTTLAGWLRRSGPQRVNRLPALRRRRARHERLAAKPSATHDDQGQGELREELDDAALAQLPAPLREAVRLRYLEGHSQKEAAHLLGCPRGTMSQRAARGIRWLRELLGGREAIVGSQSETRCRNPRVHRPFSRDALAVAQVAVPLSRRG